MHVGRTSAAVVRDDQRGIAVSGAGIGVDKGRRVDGVLVMAGTVPGVLLRVCLACVCFVNLSARRAVGLGAAIIAGASVTSWSNGALTW
jgi:hypothetical protein